MTKQEAIKILSSRDGHGIPSGYNGGYAEAIDVAIEALKTVGEIKEIINISNFVIQEDVLKYKMICEVVEKMDESTMGQLNPDEPINYHIENDGTYRGGE